MDQPPSFIDPPTLARMTADEIDKHLDRIRHTRLRGLELYEATLAKKKEITDEHTRRLLEQHLERLSAQLEKIDRHITATERLIMKVRVARISVGLDP
jgi:hypothetical protein